VRIVLSSIQCSPLRGSEPGTGWSWATSLADTGHEVTVLTSPRMRDEIESVGRGDIDFQYVAEPVKRWGRVVPNFSYYDVYLQWQDAAVRHARSYGKEFDIAHHVVWGGLHLGTQLWQLPVPCVFGPVGGGQTAPRNYARYFGSDWPLEMMRTAATGTMLKFNKRSRQAVRNSAVTLVCNSATEAAAKRLGGKDIRFMMADGLPDDALGSAHVQPSGVPIVLFVGRLISRKGPGLAVEAFSELRRQMPARLVIAGDGPLQEQVAESAKRLGVAVDVEFLGRIPLTELRGLYDSASALLFTSLRESFGAPILEAFGRGVPVVVPDLHGIADADVGEAAIKVPLPQDPDALPRLLGSALKDVLTDRRWADRSAAAIAWAADWRWSVKAATATKIYEEFAR
jgi:glycosyltransferase involved in cell wall biosynthesis